MTTIFPPAGMTVIPDPAPDLNHRKLDLDQMTAESPGDKIVLAHLWAALAEEYEQIGYKVAAESAMKKAIYWGYDPRALEPKEPAGSMVEYAEWLAGSQEGEGR